MLSPDEIRYAVKVMRQKFPDAGTTLIATTNYHFLLATILSAQSTDQSVNEVTPALFTRFPLPADLASAKPEEVEPYIKKLGLYRNKARFLVKTSQQLVTDFNGKVPQTLKELMSLSGVGRKVADVVLAECFNIPAFPVDTHVSRVARRLRMVEPNATVLTIEKKLMKVIPPKHWLDAHHSMIFWGRYVCTARNPKCQTCPLLAICETGQNNII
ncbi:endonuclease III [Limosilactobacillus agrestis]|uniref:Endonuclease III n=1 Tax=Limosilactobacillus agrestis TaxID=2759748 RepID=A0A7W3YKB9_9LACO|nr:endonuclease III [Limosilactobacillus agrestis]MBB1094668.1 endonuclease III [Limosilactobacillus agrestis]MBB1098869.1 endonuclease III [Limosilactobacillus agrestis]MCD7112271.1 endonuclease III [Limosilactobacillus agrestis]MCD7119703.1 endonuclease III [Limosilactobacillus agrestis]MCD7125859.1 endonuclease III [Limosilactobacillus agrestis]